VNKHCHKTRKRVVLEKEVFYLTFHSNYAAITTHHTSKHCHSMNAVTITTHGHIWTLSTNAREDPDDWNWVCALSTNDWYQQRNMYKLVNTAELHGNGHLHNTLCMK